MRNLVVMSIGPHVFYQYNIETRIISNCKISKSSDPRFWSLYIRSKFHFLNEVRSPCDMRNTFTFRCLGLSLEPIKLGRVSGLKIELSNRFFIACQFSKLKLTLRSSIKKVILTVQRNMLLELILIIHSKRHSACQTEQGKCDSCPMRAH